MEKLEISVSSDRLYFDYFVPLSLYYLSQLQAAPLYAILFGVPVKPPNPVTVFAVAEVLMALHSPTGDCFPFLEFKYAPSPAT
jgi:hypothetical protein